MKSLLFPSLDEFDPCDIECECIGDRCRWYPECIRAECADYIADRCDDDCKECPESGPLPECLR